MAAADRVQHAVVVLVEDRAEAATLAGVIEDVVDAESTVTRIPPVASPAFFADAQAAADLDRWWNAAIPPGAVPLYVLDFNPAIVPWLSGLDGSFIVRGCPPELADDRDMAVDAISAATPLEFAAHVLRHLATAGGCDAEEAEGLLAFAQATRPAAIPTNGHAPDPFELLASMPPPPPPPPPPAPFDAPIAGGIHGRFDSLAPVQDTPATNGTRRSLGELLRLPSLRTLRSRGERSDDLELAQELAQRGSTIVAIGSRKGGVGKTSHAAGMAIVSGSMLDAIGHRAVIVDANVANPDAWGVLNLPPGAATVRDTVAALGANLDPPRPVFATTPALACYPEARESSEYSRHEIRLLAAHLRRGFTLVVVDLSNRLPDPTGGPEAAAAAYWLEIADVVVLPTAWSKQDFNGVLDYLELPDLPPAVVAYITPRTRRHREHPLTQRYLDAIAQQARSVVQLPDEADAVRYAGMAGVPLDSVSRRLRAGYRSLTEAVILAVDAEQ
ncbi:MAG: hypothetical protein ACREN2_04235 [Candidatus Dormibacteria bacterium]